MEEETIITLEVYKPEESRLMLELCPWRLHFSKEVLRIMLSEALNQTVLSEEIMIKGYLVTGWRVYLILRTDDEGVVRFVRHFNRHVMRDIQERIKMHPHQAKHVDYNVFNQLFVQYPFYDVELATLLLGMELERLYYDPQYAWLKDQLKDYNFCSIQNYEGGKGPVFVNTLITDEFI